MRKRLKLQGIHCLLQFNPRPDGRAWLLPAVSYRSGFILVLSPQHIVPRPPHTRQTIVLVQSPRPAGSISDAPS